VWRPSEVLGEGDFWGRSRDVVANYAAFGVAGSFGLGSAGWQPGAPGARGFRKGELDVVMQPLWATDHLSWQPDPS
jgi:hypothetical protein